MTASVRIAYWADDGSSSGVGNQGTTQAVTVTAQAGETILVFAMCDQTFGAPSSCSDATNGAYGAAVIASGTSANGNKTLGFRKENVAAGTYAVTVTYSGSCGYKGVCAVCIAGVDTAGSAFEVAATTNNQSAPTTTANAVVSGAATPTSQPAIVVALTCQDNGNAATPAMGTGFSAPATGPTGWPFGFGGGDSARVEYKAISVTTSQTATFTAAANVSHFTMMAVFKEAAGGGGGPPAAAPQRKLLLGVG